MTLSRKHFIAIAEILKTYNADEEIINAFASYLRSENGNFDFSKFRDASLSDSRKIANEL